MQSSRVMILYSSPISKPELTSHFIRVDSTPCKDSDIEYILTPLPAATFPDACCQNGSLDTFFSTPPTVLLRKLLCVNQTPSPAVRASLKPLSVHCRKLRHHCNSEKSVECFKVCVIILWNLKGNDATVNKDEERSVGVGWVWGYLTGHDQACFLVEITSCFT